MDDNTGNNEFANFMSFMIMVAKTQEENLKLIAEIGIMNERLGGIDSKLAGISEWVISVAKEKEQENGNNSTTDSTATTTDN